MVHTKDKMIDMVFLEEIRSYVFLLWKETRVDPFMQHIGGSIFYEKIYDMAV